MAKMKIESRKVGSTFSNINTKELPSGRQWKTGGVFTPYGVVLITADVYPNKPMWICYQMILDGRYYAASEAQDRSETGIAIMAGKFARRVAEMRA